MRNIKKLTCFLIVLSIILLMNGCSHKTSIYVTTPAYDNVRVSLDVDNINMLFYGEIMYIQTNDGVDLMYCKFVDDEHIKKLLVPGSYYDEQIDTMELKDGDGLKYLLVTTSTESEDDEPTYCIIGWIVGTNTGFVANGPDLTKEGLDIMTQALHFSIKQTSQEDRKYCPQYLIDMVYYPTEEELKEKEETEATVPEETIDNSTIGTNTIDSKSTESGDIID